jgi:hypothetical protein
VTDPRSSRWLDPTLVAKSLALPACRRLTSDAPSKALRKSRSRVSTSRWSQPLNADPSRLSAGGALAVPSSPLTLLVATTGTIERLQSRPPLTGRRRESTPGLTDAARTARTPTRLKQVSRMARSAFRRCSKATRKPRDSKLFTRLSTQGEALRAPVRSTSNRDATSMAPRFRRAIPSASGLATDEIRNGRRRVRSTSATHISKTSTLTLPGCRPAGTASCARPAGFAFQRRSAGFGSAVPSRRRAFSTRSRARRLTFWCPVTVRQLACTRVFARELASGRPRSLPPPPR